MKFLRGLDLVLAAIGATMAVILSVVCLLYWIYLDAAPRLREEWPALVAVTLSFAALAAVAGGAFVGLRRNAPWQWLAQAGVALTLISMVFAAQRVLLG